MPPIAKHIIHDDAMAALTAWINILPTENTGGGGGFNSLPVALDDSAVTAFETAININVLANDSDADDEAIVIASTSQGANGSVVEDTAGRLVYTPENGFSGADAFTYTVRDSQGGLSNAASVSVMVGSESTATSIGFQDGTNRLAVDDVRSGVAMAISDMNSDGRDDIVRLNLADKLMVEYQTETGTFGHFEYGFVNPTNTTNQWSLAVGDVDHNGYNDILSGGYYDTIKVFKANATGSAYTRTVLPNSQLFLQGMNLVDINNDGWLDVFACHDDAESLKFRNLGSGAFTADPTLINTATTPLSDNSGNYGTTWTDYDNDGDLDLYLSKCRGGVSSPTDPRRVNQLFFMNNRPSTSPTLLN